ncbi:unnamed protein product [Tuber aestivum]|uniref:Uncharacterized protein n=1 Tax=Tuber aestivum TaxID=59557 RepID=A0A292PJB6_9PEZI|nr:unnamed protein product [Tuber aestivum]
MSTLFLRLDTRRKYSSELDDCGSAPEPESLPTEEVSSDCGKKRQLAGGSCEGGSLRVLAERITGRRNLWPRKTRRCFSALEDGSDGSSSESSTPDSPPDQILPPWTLPRIHTRTPLQNHLPWARSSGKRQSRTWECDAQSDSRSSTLTH